MNRNEEFVNELKSKNDIVSVVSKYIRLEKKGSKYWGCCPFHHEKTPSFSVNEIDQYYYCYGCKESGDILKFVQKMENCNFVESLKILADGCGMEMPELKMDDGIKKRKEEKDRILKVLEISYKHYKDNLYKVQAKPAQDYIKKRGLTRRELEDFALGYSFDFNELINFLKKQNIPEDDMVLAGVAGSKNGRVYDFFAGRLIFPIFNSFGDCIGFSARVLEKTDYAKYKNTSETPVFIKGRIVYGIHILKKVKQEEDLKEINIVEGQMDVIAMHRAGFKNTVACMGTALTPDHARELKRFSENIVLCFDGDGAGIKASFRAIEMLEKEGLKVKVASLDGGKDPDEIIKNFGKEKMQEILENALTTTDFLILTEKKKFNLEKGDEKGEFVKSAIKIISRLSTNSEKEIYLENLKSLVKIPIDFLRRDLGLLNLSDVKEVKEEVKLDIGRENWNIKAVKFILASLLYKKEYAHDDFNLEKYITNSSLLKLLDFIRSGQKLGDLYQEFDIEQEPQVKEIIDFEFMFYKGNEKKYFEECAWSLVESELKDKQAKLSEKYSNENDLNLRREIAKELSELSVRLREKRV